MKPASSEIIAAEEAIQRRPGEMYHLFQTDIADWYFTSGDISVVYDGKTYNPATIERGNITYDGSMKANTVIIKFTYVPDPINQYLEQVLVDEVWIEIFKIHHDMSPLQPFFQFVGKIINVSFKGNVAEAKCVGLKNHFERKIPRYRYLPGCNHTLYDSNTCGRDGLNESSFTQSATLSNLSSDGLELTSSSFGSYDDDWFTFGWIEYDNYRRMITSHIGNVVEIRYKIPTLQNGNTVDAIAGCDKTETTCLEKFNNAVNRLAFDYIPWENPIFRLRS